LRTHDTPKALSPCLGTLSNDEREDTLGDATNADVIVIGSGVAGLSAALTAAEGGAKVIVFEKRCALGGSSSFFHGIFAAESHMQRARFITLSRDEAFKAVMEYSHWRADPRLVRAVVDESAATITWLEKQGVQFIDVINNLLDAPRLEESCLSWLYCSLFWYCSYWCQMWLCGFPV
jgi:glycine/D-amino acid oxidase-like deaminating enzyme